MKPDNNIVVIGAGIIGATCAAYLQKAGYQVTLIDQDEPGNGCSFGNAGSISSGSITPMALPGLWKKVPAWLFDKQGPLSVNWQYLPRATPWLLAWLKAAHKNTAIKSGNALADLNKNVLNNYKNILGSELFNDLIKTTGHLIVHRQKPVSIGDQLAEQIRNQHSVTMQAINANQIKEIVPTISDEFKYGVLMTDGGFTINPQRLVNSLVNNFIAMGGVFIKNKVIEIVQNQSKPELITRTGKISVDKIVVTAGAWSKQLLKDHNMPLETERGYHLMLHDCNVMPDLPVVAADYKFFSTPMEHGLRLAGTVEIAGLKTPPKWQRAEILLQHARKVFPGIKSNTSSVWMGHRPSIPDSVPIIDKAPNNKILFFAFGHGHYGLSGAPGTAQIICDLIDNKKSDIDISPFSLARF